MALGAARGTVGMKNQKGIEMILETGVNVWKTNSSFNQSSIVMLV